MIRRQEGEQPIHIVEGDMLNVTPQLIGDVSFVTGGTFHMVYDREGLSALEPKARKAYVEKLAALMEPNGRLLLVVPEYNESQVSSSKGRRLAPFNVSAKDL